MAVVIVLIAGITALRALEGQTGPLYLIPIVVAGLWLGRWVGLGAGVASGLAIVLGGGTTDLSGELAPDSTVAAEVIRTLVLGAVGYGVGLLSERRVTLERALTRTELELEEVRTLQSALAPPEPPDRPSLELATCYIAAEHGVSGDFYVVVPAADDSTLIAVGDVAGRGLDAAKRAWYVRTLIASSADVTEDPATVLERANRGLIADAGFGVAVRHRRLRALPSRRRDRVGPRGPRRPDAPRRGRARCRATGRSGLPLGVADRLGCQTSRARLSPGGGLLLYTDGLTEARRRTDRTATGFELFGEERIASRARERGRLRERRRGRADARRGQGVQRRRAGGRPLHGRPAPDGRCRRHRGLLAGAHRDRGYRIGEKTFGFRLFSPPSRGVPINSSRGSGRAFGDPLLRRPPT